MTTLAENPTHIEKLEAREVAEKSATFHVFQWHQGRDFEFSKVHDVTDLPLLGNCDLTVIAAPFDSPSTIPDFRVLVERYEIPSGFVLERLQGVTHSFGASLAKDGSQTVWMHFLCTASSPDAENAEWLKSAAVLKWSTSTAKSQKPNNQDEKHAKAPVTLICFRPMEGICERLFHLARESNWGDVLQDPYLLLDMVYESWYLRLDESAWKTNNFCQNIEKDAFKGSRDLDATFPGPPVVDLYYVHTIAKNAIFVLEAVDATLRSLDAAIAHHQELSSSVSCPQKKKKKKRKKGYLVDGISNTRPPIWRATQGILLHRRELFQATKLRTISVEKRLTNIINLAFNVDAMRNSRITQRDSYSLKALSLVATVFLPISTVATVFSTPFFEASGPSTSPQSSDIQGGETLLVNRKFWLLWAISMPISVALIFGWWFWVKGAHTMRTRPEKDVESG